MTLLPFTLTFQLAAWATVIPITDYDCNVARGSYDSRDLAGSEAGFRVSGVIKPIKQAGGVSNWMPAAGVLFWRDDEKDATVGLQIWQVSRSKFAYGIRVLSGNRDRPRILGTLPLTEPINFSTSLDKDGRLEFEVNGKPFTIEDVGVRAKFPVLMCSGGHFTFENLSSSTN